MMVKKPVPPDTQRSFSNGWGELDYLCKKLRYWLYERKLRTRALHYRDRLERVLANLPENDRAIIREEGFALLGELDGKFDEAIAHRRREIKLIERLHREVQSPRYDDDARAYMLRNRDAAALNDRRTIVERLKATNARRADEMARS